MNSTAEPSNSRRPVIWLVLIAVVIIGGLALAAVLSTGSDKPSTSDSSGAFQSTPATATGAPLPAFDGNAPRDPAVGAEMPVLSGFDLDGTAMTITLDGRPKVIVYLAHWCPHCRREVPVLRDWLAEHPQPGVDAVSVTTSIDATLPNFPPSDWLRGEKWPMPVLVDGNGDAAAASGLTSFPYFVVVGADGTVRQRASGELSTDQIAAAFGAAAG